MSHKNTLPNYIYIAPFCQIHISCNHLRKVAIIAFWDTIQCSLVCSYQCLKNTCQLYYAAILEEEARGYSEMVTHLLYYMISQPGRPQSWYCGGKMNPDIQRGIRKVIPCYFLSLEQLICEPCTHDCFHPLQPTCWSKLRQDCWIGSFAVQDFLSSNRMPQYHWHTFPCRIKR